MSRKKFRYNYMGVPLPFSEANLYNGLFNPSTIHVQDTSLFYFFWRYLYYKVAAAFDIENQPEYWDNDYLKAVLIARGYAAVFDYEPVGVIPQNCQPGDRFDIFYRPTLATITNPVFERSFTLKIGEDCELIKLTPDYNGLGSLISFYAEQMALCAESAGVNLINSQLAFIFRVKDGKQAAALKEMFDKIRSGEPAAWVDEELFDDDGQPRWETFNSDIRSTFIAPEILEMLTAYESRFKEEIGLSDIPYEKKERFIKAEIEASNSGTGANIYTWIQCLQKSCDKVNAMFGLNLRAKRTQTEGGGAENGQLREVND